MSLARGKVARSSTGQKRFVGNPTKAVRPSLNRRTVVGRIHL